VCVRVASSVVSRQLVPTEFIVAFYARPGKHQNSTRATCHILNTGSAWQRGGDAVRSQSTSAARSRHGLGASLKQLALSSQTAQNASQPRWVGGISPIMRVPAAAAGRRNAPLSSRCWVLPFAPQTNRQAGRSSQGSAPTAHSHPHNFHRPVRASSE
jgi:hypothetical protein